MDVYILQLLEILKMLQEKIKVKIHIAAGFIYHHVFGHFGFLSVSSKRLMCLCFKS